MLTIEDMHPTANVKSGKCLSTTYKSAHSKLIWQCKFNHIWEATPNNIRKGKWCPQCAKEKRRKASVARRNTIEEAQAYAMSRGGECLTKTYTHAHEKLQWTCKRGHQWNSTYHRVVTGKAWCWKCFCIEKAGQYHVDNIENIREIIKSRAGKLLSTKYKNAYTKLKVQCDKKHIWITNAHAIKSGGWCPSCSAFLGERTFRNALEYLTDQIFQKCKPKWLKNKRGSRLEIDGFNENLNLGFEYQGKQHFKFIKGLYHRRKEEFQKLQEHDRIKKQIFQKRNIQMLYPTDSLRIKNYLKFIIDGLRELDMIHLIIPDRQRSFSVDRLYA